MKSISVLWKNPGNCGRIEITNSGKASVNSFTAAERLDFDLTDAKLSPGAFATVVTVRASDSFSFFARDVKKSAPIWIKEYSVIVTEGDDRRSYGEIESDIRSKGRRTETERLCSFEEDFDSALAKTKSMNAPTWLGLSRDVRLFEVTPHSAVSDALHWDTIQPRYHHTPIKCGEIDGRELRYDYMAGRGVGTQRKIKRWLDDGVLPILNVRNEDGAITYTQKIFASYESSPLTPDTLKGTHCLTADKYSDYIAPPTEENRLIAEEHQITDIDNAEGVAAFMRIECENTADAPKYCYMRLPQPCVDFAPQWSRWDMTHKDGFSSFNADGKVCLVSFLDGKPFSDVESSVLLGPGEKAVFTFFIPHTPISRERAEVLAKADFDEKLAEVRAFWRGKLDSMASFSLPDGRLDDMLKAGLLHLDLITYGNEPDGDAGACVGVYSPIGTESLPIIGLYESIGWKKLAERSVNYFFTKQREDGRFVNYGNYESESGSILRIAAEHYRVTHDRAWFETVKEKLVLGCQYIENWAAKSKDESLRKNGYGMIFGQVSDCTNHFHDYMLNSIAYGGVKGVSEALADVGDPRAEHFAAFADEFRQNILDSLTESFALGPAVPISDGSWIPSVSLWPEKNVQGPQSLFTFGGYAYTHAAMLLEDSNVGGGAYAVMNGVIEPEHIFASFIAQWYTEFCTVDNAGYSQPYYNQQSYINLLRGEKGAFLSELYNQVSAHADRETYTFWEHLSQVSAHKTHEEAWFLTRIRWLLCVDQFGRFDILSGAPLRWFGDGKKITVRGLVTSYGKLSFEVSSDKDGITASLSLVSNGLPCPPAVVHLGGRRFTVDFSKNPDAVVSVKK